MSCEQLAPKTVKELIAKVAVDGDFRRKIRALTKDKLQYQLQRSGEIDQISQDALSESAAKWLAALNKKRLTLILAAATQDETLLRQVVEKYLYRSSINYLNTRLRRWSHANERGQPGARARLVIDPETEAQFWDNHVKPHRLIEDAIDLEQVETRLQALKVSEEHIGYVRAYLNGDTYADMAASPDVNKHDKYRKAVNRALAKLRDDMNG